MFERITTSLPKASDVELTRLVRQLHAADERLRELLGDKVDAVLSPTGERFLLRQAQEKILQSEIMLSHAQRIAGFGSWQVELKDLVELEENPLVCSEEVFRIFGHKPGKFEISTRKFFDLIHPDDREKVRAALKSALLNRAPFAFEHRIFLLDGSVRELHLAAQILTEKDTGRPLRMVGIVRDITENKQRAEALQLSERRFAGAFEFAAIGMALVDPEGHWLKVNCALCRIVGYSAEELSRLTFQDITHTEDLHADLELMHRTIAGEIDHYQMEKRYIHKEGHIIWVWLSVALVRDRQKRPLYFVSQIQDITEQKNSQQKLAEQAALIDQARDAIILRDLDQTVRFWNKGAERIYGWTAHEAVGRKTLELMYRNSNKIAEATQAVLCHDNWLGEIESVTKNGLPIVTECRWTLLRDATGNPKSVLCINTDISERKRIESQFLRAQRIESIGTLAGGIAHDLNNLLAPILMGVDLLRHFGLSGPGLEVVDGIERSAKRGSNLVKQVLSFARGVEGARVALHVSDVVNELASIIHNTFPKNIRLETQVAENVWLIHSDPTLLHQVLLNLSLNARDAMPGGGTISILAENQIIDQPYAVTSHAVALGRYVLVEVSDTGCGIPKENLERIFDPFFTTKELGKGTGLGLATALGIIRSHGGFVNVASEVGQGSTFKIYLPAQIEDSLAIADEKDRDDWPRGNGECILLVDDETSILNITRQILEAFNYRVLTAEHGAQAVSVYATNRDKIALVMTDMMMPIMDGPATIVALRQLDPGIKIIAASGLNSSGGVARATQAGVKHFLAKPYATGTMLLTIKAVLSEGS